MQTRLSCVVAMAVVLKALLFSVRELTLSRRVSILRSIYPLKIIWRFISVSLNMNRSELFFKDGSRYKLDFKKITKNLTEVLMSAYESSPPMTARLYSYYSSFLNYFRCPFLFLIRLLWGTIFLMAGFGKLQHLEQVAEFFTSIGIPYASFNAGLVGFVELFCGLCLILGFLSRLAALPLIIVMIVAYVTAHAAAVAAAVAGSDPSIVFSQPPFSFLFACLVILFFGPGDISIDNLLSRKFIHPKGPKGAAGKCCQK